MLARPRKGPAGSQAQSRPGRSNEHEVRESVRHLARGLSLDIPHRVGHVLGLDLFNLDVEIVELFSLLCLQFCVGHLAHPLSVLNSVVYVADAVPAPEGAGCVGAARRRAFLAAANRMRPMR